VEGDQPHESSAQGASHAGFRAVAVALVANMGVAAAKLIGFLITGSGSMVAEFAHSVADTGNQILLLAGRRESERRPDPTHPFGYGAVRFLGAFVVAVLLFGLGAVFSMAEGVNKLIHPHPLDNLPVALAILVVAIVLEALSFRAGVAAANQTRRGEGWVRFVRSTRIPELAVLLVEDTGALVGLVIALVAVAVSALTGNTVFDAVGSLGIGVLLGVNSVVLGIEMTSLLVGETASPDELQEIEERLATTPGIRRVVHLRAVHLGPEELLVGAKVLFTPGLTVEEAAAVVDEAESAVRSAVPSAVWIYIEPGRTDEASPAVAPANNDPGEL
jgi:cation diffusion facilitator family transporter